MNSPRKKRRLQVKPLVGQFFDMKPSQITSFHPKKASSRQAFLGVVLSVFFLLISFRLWTSGQAFFEKNKQVAQQGIHQLNQAVKAAEGLKLSEAKQAFLSAHSSFEALNQNLKTLIPPHLSSGQKPTTLSSVQTLTQWTSDLSQWGADLTAWAETHMQDMPSFESVLASDASLFLDQVKRAQYEFNLLMERAQILEATLSGLKIPFLETPLSQARQQFATLKPFLEKTDQALKGVNLLLGSERPHDYLILFQNSNERRATGGFIGSVATVRVEKGIFGDLQPYDIYAIDRHLKEVIPAPAGIKKISPEGRFYSRDANYWPDFPTSSEAILDLMQKSGMPSFDSVVAIDQVMAETLLRYIPPLSTEDDAFEINSETFSPLLQFYTEAKLSESMNPKAFLFSLIPQVQAALSQLEDAEELFKSLLGLAERGYIQAYSVHPEVQLIWDEARLSGRLLFPVAEQDFLSVISTSIGGNKSDRYLHTAIDHVTQWRADGAIKNELTLKKRHVWQGSSWDIFQRYVNHYGTGKLDLKSLRFILGEGGHVDYMRVYVPKGSALLDAQGVDFEAVETYEDLGYTVFSFVFGPVSPGEIQEVKLIYDLPFSLEGTRSSYSFTAQPQAASKNLFLNKRIQEGEGWQVLGGESSLGAQEGAPPELDVLFEKKERYRVDLAQI